MPGQKVSLAIWVESQKDASHFIMALKNVYELFVGSQFIGAPPIYRPGKGIDGPLADKSAVGAINRPLQSDRSAIYKTLYL